MLTTIRAKSLTLLVIAGCSFVLGGCATKAQTGALIGVAGGAAVGGVIGRAAGSTATGVVIGAAVGGVAGGIIGARMDRQARELAQNIPGATVERVGEGITVTFASGMLYDFDSAVLRPEAQRNLRTLANSLGKYPGSDILIVGHTDQVGSAGYNQSLSERRAVSAANYLRAQDLTGTHVSTRGMGVVEN